MNEIGRTLTDTQVLIYEVCEQLAHFVKSKNEKYGDSALKPLGIFAKGDNADLISVRIDDKLNRIINSEKLRKNDCVDLAGYLILLFIANGWTDFSEMID